MTVTLRLWKDGDPSKATEHVLQEDLIGIGRELSNTIQIVSPNISKKHVQLEQRSDGLFLTDLKSRNGTYLNGVKIPPENPQPLMPGDKARICDYIFEVVGCDGPTSPPVVSPGTPVVQEVPLGLEVTRGEEEPVSSEKEQVNLQPVMMESTGVEGDAERPATVSQPITQDGRLAEENATRLAAVEEECERLRNRNAMLEQKLAAISETPPPVHQVDNSLALARLKTVLESVLEPVLKIMRGRILFRSEFMGATMFQDLKMEALSKLSPKEWIEFFLDAELEEQMARNRLEILGSETAEMIIHVMGLLDGYRKSVDVGAKSMLQQLNPVRIKEELFKQPVRVGPLSIPYRFLPLVAEWFAWRAFEQHHRELQEEDRGILEQRFFRPGFIQGYMNCIASAKHEPLTSRHKKTTSVKTKP
jgi:pSer/pThr/pTyr-binding forkhead associated (FHA) protein